MGNLLSFSTPKDYELAEELPEKLPEDIMLTKILPKLPVKSLMRFKCVSKKWFEIITSDYFISTHLRHQSESTNLFIIPTKHGHPRENMRVLLLLDESKNVEDISHFTKSMPTCSDETAIVGSCNGLVCITLSSIGTKSILWNPATREFRYLPDPMPLENATRAVLGFGFDENDKDYKFLRIVETEAQLLKFQLFTKSNDSWRQISSSMPGYRLERVNSVAVVINGTFYWLAYKLESEFGIKLQLLSFNLQEEAVQETADVPAGDKLNYYFLKLTKWKKNSLALLAILHQTEYAIQGDFWVLGHNFDAEHKNKSRWSKLFKVISNSATWGFCGVWRDQLLIEENEHEEDAEELILYNPFGDEHTKSRKLIKKAERNWTFVEAHEYVPSLVSVYPDQKVEKKKKIDDDKITWPFIFMSMIFGFFKAK